MAGTPTGSPMLPAQMDPMRQHVAGRVMLPSQPGVPVSPVQRMTPHPESMQQQRMPISQGYHPAMRPAIPNHPMNLPLQQSQGIPGM
jgi:hypothetical protein